MQRHVQAATAKDGPPTSQGEATEPGVPAPQAAAAPDCSGSGAAAAAEEETAKEADADPKPAKPAPSIYDGTPAGNYLQDYGWASKTEDWVPRLTGRKQGTCKRAHATSKIYFHLVCFPLHTWYVLKAMMFCIYLCFACLLD